MRKYEKELEITCDVSGQSLFVAQKDEKPMLGSVLYLNTNNGSSFSLDNQIMFDFNQEITKDIINFVKERYNVDLLNIES